MKILDALKSLGARPEKHRDGNSPATPDTPPESSGLNSALSPAQVWYMLSEDPNRADLLPQLLTIAGRKGGPSAEYAALAELAEVPGSWLPQTYLGKMALEAGRFDEAAAYYGAVLSLPEPPDYALFMISADLGRTGFGSRMPDLLLPFFTPENNNLYIGLNLLEALREAGRKDEGLALLERIRPYENPQISEYLDGFENAFAAIPGTAATKPTSVTPAGASGSDDPGRFDGAISSDHISTGGSEITSGSHEAAPDLDKSVIQGDGETVTSDVSSLPEEKLSEAGENSPEEPRVSAPITRPVMLDLPVWSQGLLGLQDLLPNTVDRPRVGLYMYADTTPASRRSEPIPGQITPDEMAVSLPAVIADRLLFTTGFKPVTLFPVVREIGPFGGNLEPDVQGLFSLCSKEALDYLVTGTIYQDHNVLRIRTWVLDRTKQSARVVATDLPIISFGDAFLTMLSEIFAVFSERHNARSAAKSELLYTLPPADMIPRYLKSMKELVLRYLVRQNECDPSILTDPESALSMIAVLADKEPKNQIVFAMLLTAMLSSRKLGSSAFVPHRQLLYEIADKSRYTPCVKAVMKELNLVLQD